MIPYIILTFGSQLRKEHNIHSITKTKIFVLLKKLYMCAAWESCDKGWWTRSMQVALIIALVISMITTVSGRSRVN